MVFEAAVSSMPEDPLPEQELIAAAQRDPRRFAELYEGNFERVYAFVARRVHDRDEAEDLTAEIFHRALANLDRFEWRGLPFCAWLYRIAANAIADHAQRAARDASLPKDVAGEAANPEEVEEAARLFRLVADLPPDQRRVIVMRFAEQRKVREIAAALGRSEGAIKQLQFRALQNLRARLGERNA
jgi:RNA polymerase sigma-70 factor (ECF subfamily)